jgi:adenylate kinase
MQRNRTDHRGSLEGGQAPSVGQVSNLPVRLRRPIKTGRLETRPTSIGVVAAEGDVYHSRVRSHLNRRIGGLDQGIRMSSQRYHTVLLFGAPGVGKGTQGRILGQIPGFFHLSVGDVFRSLDINSPDGKEVYKYSSQGILVPDETTIRIWKRNLDALTILSLYKPHEDLLILDGIPRNRRQAEIVEEHIEVQKIVHLRCADTEAMVHRIRRRAIRENRVDDAHEDIIRKRFQVYENDTKPVLDYYSKKLMAEVDAMGSPAAVLLNVLKCVVPVQNAHFRHEDL